MSRWIYSPRAAVRFTPGQSLVLRGSIATGFRAPEIFDKDFHIEILEDQFERRFLQSPRWSGLAQLNYRNPELFNWFLGLVYIQRQPS